MDINMKTKFNIGDKVWIPDVFDGEYYVEDKCYVIQSITIGIDDVNTVIQYYLRHENNIGFHYAHEHKMFNSYKEACDYCKTQNN